MSESIIWIFHVSNLLISLSFRQMPACVEKIVSCLLNGWSLAHAPCSRSLCGMPLVQSDDTQTVVCPQCNFTKFVIKRKEQSYCDPHLKSNPLQDIKEMKSSCITEAEINEMVAAIRVNGYSPTTRVCNSCGLELFKHVSGYSICLVCHPTVSLGGKHSVVQNKIPRCNINATTMFDEERQETAPREKAKSQEKRHDIPIASHRRALNLYCETKVEHCKRNGSTISLSSAFTKGAQIVATARCDVCNGPFMRCRFSKVVVCGSKGCPKGISQSNNIGVVFRYPGVNWNISRRTNEIRYRTGHEKSDGYMNKYESRDKTLPHSTFDHALWDTAHGGTISPARIHFQNKVGNCHNYSRMSNKHTLFPERATKRSLPIIFDDNKTLESKPFDED